MLRSTEKRLAIAAATGAAGVRLRQLAGVAGLVKCSLPCKQKGQHNINDFAFPARRTLKFVECGSAGPGVTDRALALTETDIEPLLEIRWS